MKILFIILISYFIGNISTGYILGKVLKNSDIRTMGSGNAGATNALRVYGIGFGILTLLFDCLKGVLAAYIGNKILGYDGALIASFFVVIGHDFPILMGFKGGKGIATSLGILIYLHYPTAIALVIIFVSAVALTRYVSFGSVSAGALVGIVGIILKRPFDYKFLILTLVLGAVAIYKHKDNIKRLKNGTESKLGQRV